MLSGELNPDIVLLDISMPEMDGLETALHLSKLPNPPAIIFTTAFGDHALAAFEAHAVDYLLKPIRIERLQKAIENAQRLNRVQLANLGQSTEAPDARSHISVNVRGNIHLIPVPDIIYFLADQKYVNVCHCKGEVLIEESLKSLEDEFGELFIRIHRKALVAIEYMEGIEKDESGYHCVSMRGTDAKLEISRRHLAAVRKKLKNLNQW